MGLYTSTPVELWTGRKAIVQHYRIQRCLVYVFKGKIENLDIKSELCYFVGYPKGWLFYDPEKQIVLVSTAIIFLEDNYMMDQKPNNIFNFKGVV